MARTVLVADDSPTIQNKAKSILSGVGFDVITVSNGVAAIKKLSQIRPLLVLADISMPGKDGYEVCDFVKKSPELHDVPVVLIASETEPYDPGQGARVHANAKIEKMVEGRPFDQDELVSIVTKLVAEAEAAAAPPAVTAPPDLRMVTEPVDEVPMTEMRKGVDLGSLSGSAAFAEPGAEDVPLPTPLTEFEKPSEAAFGAEEAEGATAPRPPLAFEPPTAGAVAGKETEPSHGAGLWSEPASAAAGPAWAEEPPASTGSPLLEEPAIEAPDLAEPLLTEEAEPTPPPAAPGPGQTITFRAPTDLIEPVFTEELSTAPPPAAAPAAAERTVMFRMPSEIAPPVLSDELAPPPAAPPPPVAATTLESFSLTDAAAGQVRFTPPETGAPPEAAEAPAEAAAPAFVEVDANLIYLIVYKAVARMAPPALAQELVDDLARKITDDIIAEFNAQAAQSQ